MVLGRKTNFFLGKRFFLACKTNFFLDKKKHFLRHWFWAGNPTFSEEKDGFGQENQLFPRTKMVLGRKTNFS